MQKGAQKDEGCLPEHLLHSSALAGPLDSAKPGKKVTEPRECGGRQKEGWRKIARREKEQSGKGAGEEGDRSFRGREGGKEERKGEEKPTVRAPLFFA